MWESGRNIKGGMCEVEFKNSRLSSSCIRDEKKKNRHKLIKRSRVETKLESQDKGGRR